MFSLWQITRNTNALPCDQENDKETSAPLSPKEVFVDTRKRKDGRSYKFSDEDTTSKISEMEEIEAQQNENGNESVDAFAYVMSLNIRDV